MAKKQKKAAYVCFVGKQPGIYFSWEECKQQTDRFPGQKQRGFFTRHETQTAWNKWREEQKPRPISVSGNEDQGRPNGYHYTSKIEVPDSEEDEDIFLESHDDYRRNPSLKRAADNEFAYNIQPPLKKISRIGAPADVPIAVDSESVCIPAEPAPILTPEQQSVVTMALDGHNIFLTGAAGSGKTVTLKAIRDRLQQREKGACVEIIAPTGIAALPLGGKTTYSFVGWIPDSLQQPKEKLITKSRIKDATISTIRHLDVLVIEEISMVENQFLERLDLLMQCVLDNQKPMGGKQVVFVGDFYQHYAESVHQKDANFSFSFLPPVNPFEYCLECGEPIEEFNNIICRNMKCERFEKKLFQDGDGYAFRAPVWAKLNLKHVMLEQIHRQKDSGFQTMLNKIRNGIILNENEWLTLTAKKALPKDIAAVKLMPKRDQAKRYNSWKLNELNQDRQVWNSYDTAYKLVYSKEDKDEPRASQIRAQVEIHKDFKRKHHRLPGELVLKLGAKVILLHNISIKMGLVNGSQGEVVSFRDTANWPRDKKEPRSERQARMDFERSNNDMRPVVRFSNNKTITVKPYCLSSQRRSFNDKYLVSRTQIPLALGWALSIHKSQGMTLQYVEVCRDRIFEGGQLYVGLSRATSLGGLVVTGYSREQLKVPSHVLKFYETASWERLGPSNSSTTEGGKLIDGQDAIEKGAWQEKDDEKCQA